VSAPLLALGEIEAGAAMALMFGATAAYFTGKIVAIYSSPVIGGLAATVFWAHPLTQAFATNWMPETLSITLVCATIYFAIRHYGSGRYSKLFISILLVLSVFVHLWEIAVLLPLVTIAAWHGDIRGSADFSITALAAAIFVLLIGRLQPFTQSSMTRYALWVDPSVLLSTDFWHLPPDDFLGYSITILLPIGVFSFITASGMFYKTKKEKWILVASILFSGISIPFGLANGFYYHTYYLWLLLPGVAMFVAFTFDCVQTLVRRWISRSHVNTLIIVSITIMVIATGFGVSEKYRQGGQPHAWADSQKRIGEYIADSNLDASELVFVGDFNSGHYGQNPTMSRILVYSDLLVKYRRPITKQSEPFPVGGPRFYPNISKPVPHCELLIMSSSKSLEVRPC